MTEDPASLLGEGSRPNAAAKFADVAPDHFGCDCLDFSLDRSSCRCAEGGHVAVVGWESGTHGTYSVAEPFAAQQELCDAYKLAGRRSRSTRAEP